MYIIKTCFSCVTGARWDILRTTGASNIGYKKELTTRAEEMRRIGGEGDVQETEEGGDSMTH